MTGWPAGAKAAGGFEGVVALAGDEADGLGHGFAAKEKTSHRLHRFRRLTMTRTRSHGTKSHEEKIVGWRYLKRKKKAIKGVRRVMRKGMERGGGERRVFVWVRAGSSMARVMGSTTAPTQKRLAE